MKNLRWIKSIALITMAVLSVVGEVRGESQHARTVGTTASATVNSVTATTAATSPCRGL